MAHSFSSAIDASRARQQSIAPRADLASEHRRLRSRRSVRAREIRARRSYILYTLRECVNVMIISSRITWWQNPVTSLGTHVLSGFRILRSRSDLTTAARPKINSWVSSRFFIPNKCIAYAFEYFDPADLV